MTDWKKPCSCDTCERDRRSFVGAPEDALAERAVLGVVMLDNRRLPEVQAALRSDDFAQASNRVVYEAMGALALRRAPIDVNTLSEAIAAMGSGAFGQEGLLPMLASLDAEVPSLGNAGHYVARVKECATRRNLMQAAAEMTRAAKDRAAPIADVLAASDRSLFAVSQGLASEDELPSFRAMLLARQQALVKRSASPSEVTGLRTGFIDIDKITRGLRGGQLVIVAGRPGHRKSLLAAHVARNAADTGGKPVALFSLEMRADAVVDRYMTAEARMPFGKFQSGRFSTEDASDWHAIDEGNERLLEIVNRANIYIFDRSPMTTAYIHAKCRQIVARDRRLGLVVIDYAQLLDGDVHDKHQNREREVARISRACKMLAMDLNLPVIILSQLNREAEKRDNKRPVLSDLRETGALEQDADIVLGTYCADKYSENSPDANIMEVIVLKQRDGRTGTIGLSLHAGEMRIGDLAPGTQFGEERERAAKEIADAHRVDHRTRR